MFINAGARNLLLEGERQRFLGEEWPRIHATIQRLGLKPEELLDAATRGSSSDTTQSKTADRLPADHTPPEHIPEEER